MLDNRVCVYQNPERGAEKTQNRDKNCQPQNGRTSALRWGETVALEGPSFAQNTADEGRSELENLSPVML